MTSSADHPDPACLICAKHLGIGPLAGVLIGRRDGFWVYHAPPGEDGRAPLGHLFIETDRHVPSLADLTDAEAAALGPLRSQLAHALRAEVDADWIFAAVIGRRVPHFHEHLLPRHRDLDDAVPWHQSDVAGPHVDDAAVVDLARRLAARVPGLSSGPTS
jgi:ATP adenylyltransferase